MFFRTRLKPFTGFIEEVAVYRFVVLFAVACICLVLAGSAGAQTFSCPARHRGHAELFCDELSRSRGLSHGTGECESNLFGDFSRQWTELCDNWIFCLDQRREWISVGCQDIRSEFRVRPQHGTHVDRSADV